MTDIVEPDEDLWKWVVQNGGQARDVLWPPDSETAVRDLGAAWSSSAKALKDAIDGSGNVAKALERTWPDAAGFELRYVIDSLNNGSLGEAGLKELVTAMESLGLACQDYANKVQGAKYQIRAYISRNIKAFAAALADQVGKAPVETAKPPAKPEPPHGFWGNVGAFFVGIGEGAVDMVKGFAGLVGLGEDWHFSWSTLGQSWGGLGKFALAAVTYGTPGLSAIDQSVGLPFFQRGEMGETLTEAGKVMIAYDLWSEDPARAAGKTTFNIASAVLGTKGAGAAIRGAGAAVKGSKVGAVATAGRIVEQAGTAITKIPTVSEVAVQAAKRLPGLLDTLRGVDRFEHGSPGTSPHVIDTPPPHQPPNTSETRLPGQPPKDLPDRVPPEQSPNRAPHEPPRPPTEHPPKSGSVGEAMDPHRSPTGQPHTSGGERPHESGARDPHAGGSPRGDHQSHEPAKSPAHQEQPKQSEAGRHGEPSQRLEAAGRPEQASHLEAAKSPEPAGHHEAAENPESSKHQEQHGESVSSAGRPTARLDPETGRFQLSDEIPAHETREQVVLREEEIVRKAQEEWAESKPVQPQTPTQTVIYAVTRALGLTHTMDDFAHGVHITPSSEPSTPHPTREPVPKDREKTVPDEEASAKPPLKLGDPGLPPLHAPGNSVAHVDLAAGKVGRIDPPEPPSPPRSPKPEPPDPVPPKPKPESAAAGSPHSPKPENWSPEPRPENELPGPRPENRLPDPRPENRLPEQRPENRLPERRSENRLPDPRPENRLPDLAKEPEWDCTFNGVTPEE
jgi:hypothetical protein